MKNKRGFLLAEETLKIIIAVISIGFLVYFLTALYLNNKNSEELELAKASLNYIDESIKNNVGEVEIYNPENWIILSWMDDLPNSCSNLGWRSCLCIAKNPNLLQTTWYALPITSDLIEKLKKNSDSGYCIDNVKRLVIKKGINIDDPPIKLEIDYSKNSVIKVN